MFTSAGPHATTSILNLIVAATPGNKLMPNKLRSTSCRGRVGCWGKWQGQPPIFVKDRQDGGDGWRTSRSLGHGWHIIPPSPRPPLARSAARTASLTKSEPQPESGAAATKRPNETTDGWNERKVVMTTAASGAKQLENDDDAAAADCQRGKGNFFPPLPKAGAI